MMRRLAVCLVSLALAAPAWAQEQEQQEQQGQQQGQQDQPQATGGSGMPMDLTKMGPWTRKPTNESKARKEIEAFLKQEDDIMKRRDFEASLARIDFPIFMATDNSQGVPMTESYDRQKYTEQMRPVFEQMPADIRLRHDPEITMLSDSLASVTDNYTLTTGGKKYNGRNAGLLVKEDGQWKWKAFVEPGWGDMRQQTGVGGAGMQEGHEGQEKEKRKK